MARILAENEVLRTTIGAYSALQTGDGWSGKNARSDAALETTKQLLRRAEHREQKLATSLSKVISVFI